MMMVTLGGEGARSMDGADRTGDRTEELVVMGMSVLADLSEDPDEGEAAEMFGELLEAHGVAGLLDLLQQAAEAAADVHPSEPRLRRFSEAVGVAAGLIKR